MKKKDGIILRLIKDSGPIAGFLTLGAVLDICAVLCAVAAPEILGEAIDRLYDYSAGDAPIRASLVPNLVKLALVYAGYSLFSYWTQYIMNTVITRYFTQNMRIRISDKLRRLSVGYVDQTPVGDILTRMIDDVSTVGGYVHQVFDAMIKGFFQILLLSAAMFLESPILACFVVLLTPLSVCLSSKIASIGEKYYEEMFDEQGKLTELVEEAFSNYPTTKAYNLEEYMADKHATVNARVKDAKTKAYFMDSIVQPLIRFSNAAAYILICLIGGLLIVRERISVGAVVTILLYARQFADPLEQIALGLSNTNQVIAAARRVYALLDREEEDPGRQRCSSAPRGDVEFSHVEFSYSPDTPLIQNLNLHILPGQRIAIVGPTGAGKTTIVNLLMRFYDISDGVIRLDGQDIGQLRREDVRSVFGMVLQDTWLFRGTVAENVAYGKPGASLEEICDACRKAHCDHFIRTMPNGYDTIIGDDTTNLSGGQKQLLTIARALLANRPLLILDEATSNVDTRTEILIQRAMDELMEGKTCFVIAHRLSTIVDSDLILVLDHGRIVEQGTHASLLEKHGFYERLYCSQYAI